MSEFDHFILTRFNLNVDYAHPATRLDPKWLDHRFELFDSFCYPSVRGQSRQDFKWLVFFDADTSSKYKENITRLSAWDNFAPIFISAPTEEYLPIMRDAIRNRMSKGAHRLITTRLDNDDALGIRFVETLQTIVENKRDNEPECINFTSGYILNRSTSKLYLTTYPSNQFISFVEQINNFQTVYCEAHTCFSTVSAVREVMLAPLWLQVIHEKNVSNWVHGVRTPVKGLKSFAVRAAIPCRNDWLSCLRERSQQNLKGTMKRLAPRLVSLLVSFRDRRRQQRPT